MQGAQLRVPVMAKTNDQRQELSFVVVVYSEDSKSASLESRISALRLLSSPRVLSRMSSLVKQGSQSFQAVSPGQGPSHGSASWCLWLSCYHPILSSLLYGACTPVFLTHSGSWVSASTNLVLLRGIWLRVGQSDAKQPSNTVHTLSYQWHVPANPFLECGVMTHVSL